MGRACAVLALTLIIVGWVTMAAFFRPQWRNTPAELPAQQTIEHAR
jgi:hypothetical protein